MQSKIQAIFVKSAWPSPNLLKSSRSCDPTPPFSAIRLSHLTEFWGLLLEPNVPDSLSTFFQSVCCILSPSVNIQMSVLNIFLVLLSLLLTCHILRFHQCKIFAGRFGDNTATIGQILTWTEGQNSQSRRIGWSEMIRSAETVFWVWNHVCAQILFDLIPTHEVLQIFVSPLFLVADLHDKFLPNTQV